MSEPIMDLDNVCTKGYVQVCPEPDYAWYKAFYKDLGHSRKTPSNPNSYRDLLRSYVEKNKVTLLTTYIGTDSAHRTAAQPLLDEGVIHHWCTHDATGRYNMPDYVEQRLMMTSTSHVRVCTVRDMRSGAYYPFTFIWCPDVKVAQIAADNLQSHFDQGPISAWLPEVNPAMPGKKHPVFPEVLNQLPPALYEYKVGESSPLGYTCFNDLHRFQKDPYGYVKTSSPVLGF